MKQEIKIIKRRGCFLVADGKEKPVLVQIGKFFFELKLSFELDKLNWAKELREILADRTVRLLKDSEYLL